VRVIASEIAGFTDSSVGGKMGNFCLSIFPWIPPWLGHRKPLNIVLIYVLSQLSSGHFLIPFIIQLNKRENR
jgi:hypothetical protein